MFQLLRASTQLIRKDPIIVVPSVIGAFITTWLVVFLKIDPNNISMSPNVISYIFTVWALNILLQLLITDFGKSLLTTSTVSMSDTVKRTLKRYFPALFWISLITISLMLFILLINISYYILIAAFPFILLITVIIQLFPIAYVLSDQPSFKIIKVIITFIKERWRPTMRIFIIMVIIGLLSILATELINAFPAALTSVINPFIQGFFQVLLNLTIILLWKSNTNHISIKA